MDHSHVQMVEELEELNQAMTPEVDQTSVTTEEEQLPVESG